MEGEPHNVSEIYASQVLRENEIDEPVLMGPEMLSDLIAKAWRDGRDSQERLGQQEGDE